MANSYKNCYTWRHSIGNPILKEKQVLITQTKNSSQVAENKPNLIALYICEKLQIVINANVLKHIESVHHIMGTLQGVTSQSGITESLRLEKISKIKSNHLPNTTMPTKPCPEVPHLHVF